MAGFSNPIIGGGGSLVYPSIHSPGFETGVTGWSIDKNGDAEFNDVTIRGTFFGVDFIFSADGLFVYGGTPALGNLAISVAAAATTADSFGNAVQGGGLKAYGTAGQSAFLGLFAGLANLRLGTGASFEKTAANLATGVSGAGAAQQLEGIISGPQGSHASQQDWVQVVMTSGSNGSGAKAGGSLLYIDSAGAVHTIMNWNSTGIEALTVNGMALTGPQADPGAESLTPGAAFGAPPSSGAGTGCGFFTSGDPALSYLTAVETSYNSTRAALVDLISRYNSMRSALVSAGIM